MPRKMKPGWKTTEFWFACILPNLGGIFFALAGVLPPAWAFLCISISNSCYIISRGVVKKACICQSKNLAQSKINVDNKPAKLYL